MKHLNDLEELKEAIASDSLTVIDFYAQWCGPCKRLAPRYQELSDEHTTVNCYKVDVDEADGIAMECKIQAMPTFHFYRSGELLESFEGADGQKLEETIARLNTTVTSETTNEPVVQQ